MWLEFATLSLHIQDYVVTPELCNLNNILCMLPTDEDPGL